MKFTKSSYREYIASEPWRNRRRNFLTTHSECDQCHISSKVAEQNYDQGLHVHHKTYLRVGTELDSDLAALCRRCHEVETFGDSDLPITDAAWWMPSAEQLAGLALYDAEHPSIPTPIAGLFDEEWTL